jgi:nucleotide-binding universal stress UspA family protein
MKVKPIVAATDGSEESLQAVEWAAGEAIRHAERVLVDVSSKIILAW